MREVLTWIWVFVTAAGFIRSMIELRRARITETMLRDAGVNGAILIVSKTSIQLEALRGIIQGLLLLAGLAVLTTWGTQVQRGEFVRWCLVIAACLLFLKSEMASRVRQKVLNYREEVQ